MVVYLNLKTCNILTKMNLFISKTRVAGLLSVTAALAAGCSPAGKQERPNILFIMSDDHAYQAISAYGEEIGKYAPTPNIDRIASDGMLFNRCLVTNSICGPSRATILSGKYSHD